MTKSRLLVLIPALNEAASISRVVCDLKAQQYEVLVIDDCSSDQTAELAAVAGATVLRLPVNLGVGGALRAGFRFAVDSGFSSVVQVDADGQHPSKQINHLEDAVMEFGAHLVIGSRYLSPDSTLVSSVPRRFSMWLLSRVASRIAGLPLTDTTSGFRLIREPLLSEFAREFPSHYLGDTYEATIAAARAGYSVVEVPAALSPRLHGKSSASTSQAVLMIAKVLISAIAKLHVKLRPLSDPEP
jgi:glycosyltransferase involved in cell wall biosynthesis